MRKLLMVALLGLGAVAFGMEDTAKADHCYGGYYDGYAYAYPSYSYGYNPGYTSYYPGYAGYYRGGYAYPSSGFSLYIGSGRRGWYGRRGWIGGRRGYRRGWRR